MKILSCEDHDLLRDGLHPLLRSLPGNPSLLEASTAADAREILAREGDVALVLLDLGLPDVDGLDLLSEIRAQYPATGVVVFSGSTRASDVRAALDRGAQGYIPKSASREDLVDALAKVLDGEVYVPPSLLQAAEAIASTHLTPRQREVAELLVRGLTNREIGDVLGIRMGTVKNYVEAILAVLEVSNRTEAVLALVDRGLVAPQREGT